MKGKSGVICGDASSHVAFATWDDGAKASFHTIFISKDSDILYDFAVLKSTRFRKRSIIARNVERSVGDKDATGATDDQPEIQTRVT